VDTPAMVARASELATDKLKFFSSIQEAADWLGPIDVMHSNGALQYTPAPETTLRQLCELGASRMIWGRLYFGQPEKQVSLLSENGPGQMRLKEKSVRYSRLGISEAAFLEAHQGYSLNRRDEGGFLFAAQIVPPIGRNEQGGVMK